MNIVIILLLFLLLLPAVLGVTGIVLLFSPQPERKRKGTYFLLAGVLLFLVEVLIGYSLCSNMHLGGLH